MFKKNDFSDSLIILALASAIGVEIIIDVAAGYYYHVLTAFKIIFALALIPVSVFYKYGVAPSSKIIWIFVVLVILPGVISNL